MHVGQLLNDAVFSVIGSPLQIVADSTPAVLNPCKGGGVIQGDWPNTFTLICKMRHIRNKQLSKDFNIITVSFIDIGGT